MSEQGDSSYEQERRAKVQKLRELGVDPFGQRTENISACRSEIVVHAGDGHDAGPTVTVGAGDVQKRFGKLTFLTLRDETGDLQVALDKSGSASVTGRWRIDPILAIKSLHWSLGTTKTKGSLSGRHRSHRQRKRFCRAGEVGRD